MKKRILMLGAGFMQGIAISCAKEKGWEVIACDGNPLATCRDMAHQFEPIDLKDVDSLVSFARSLRDTGGLDGVFTAATDFSASVAAVASACDLPGHSLESALNASNKTRMRACFDKFGVPSPRYVISTSSNSADCIQVMQEQKVAFPVVVKPVDNMGARGCRLVEDTSSLASALLDAIAFSRSGTAIIEEFIDGPEFSVEGLFFNGELHLTGLADRHIRFPPYFIEMGHTIPSSCSPEIEAAIVGVFNAGIRALGLSHGAVKGDIKLSSRGPMVGEIAGRLSGGYMSGWTFPYSSGLDLTGAALDLCVGLIPLSLEPVQSLVCAERAWISLPGVVANVSGLQRARTIPGIRDVFPRVKEGDRVVFPRNNVEKCGNCLAVASDEATASNAAEEACRSIFLRLVPSIPETETFLFAFLPGSDLFPPHAFDLPEGDFFQTADSVPIFSEIYLPQTLLPYLDSVHDWHGMTLRSALEKALSIEPCIAGILCDSAHVLFERFWKAFIRGSIQGLVYVYDTYSIK